MVNGGYAPLRSAGGPAIPIGDVPVGGFALGWDIQDTGSGIYAASNHYTLTRSGAVVAASAVTNGVNGDGKASALSISATVPRASMIWGNYVLSLAGSDFDPEWVGDISRVSNVYYFVIAAPSIGVSPSSLAYGTVDKNVTSNRTVVVTNSGNAALVISSIDFTDQGHEHFSVSSPALPLTVAPGTASNVVVSFTPTAGGDFNVTMTLNNNSPDHAAQTLPITGACLDPETAPPTLVAFRAVDPEGLTNNVTDHALGHGDVEVGFTLYHVTGMKLAGSSYNLFAPDGTQVKTNASFTAMTPVTLDEKSCHEFTALVPDFYPAILGVYTAQVTAVSVNDKTVTDAMNLITVTVGSVYGLNDNFNRADGSTLGGGWTRVGNGVVLNSGMLKVAGSGANGVSYAWNTLNTLSGFKTTLNQNTEKVQWVVNLRQSRPDPAGFASGAYSLAVVLAGSSSNVTAGTGYALLRGNSSTPDPLRLVKYSAGVGTSTDLISLNDGSNTAYYAVMVEYDPSNNNWTMSRASSASTFPDVDTVTYGQVGSAVVDSTYVGSDRPYVAAAWSHSTGTDSALIDNFRVYTTGGSGGSASTAFTVYDEDIAGPEHLGFNVDGSSFSTNAIAGGLTVTGLVADANGVYAGTSNVWTLFSNGIQKATGSMAMTPNTDGAGMTASPAALSATIPFSALDTTNGTYTFQLVSTDYDLDRPGDSLSITNTFTFTIVDKEAPTPINVTATGDGMEMAVLTWDLNTAKGAVVLRSTNAAAISGAKSLKNATAYNQGDAGPNGTTVAYHGTNQTGVEIVLPMGSVNYFRVFGANGTIYSSGYADPTGGVTLLKYEDGEIVDQFAYTNNYIWTTGEGGTNWAYLNDQAGTGQGWNGPWTGDINKALTIEDVNLLCGDYTQFPDPYANKLQWVPNTQEATSVAITRKLATKRSGKTFIAFMMNYKVGNNDCDLSNKYIGLSLMSGATADKEEIFFGKLHGRDKDAGIEVPATGKFISNTPYYAFNAKHHDDYMIVGEWDPAIKTARMWAFYQGDITPIPQEYTNAPPIATFSNAAFNVADITGIRLAAGMTSADTNTIDHAYFDEVRVGDTWDEVLCSTIPKLNFRVGEQRGTGTNTVYVVTDGQLAERARPIRFPIC
jgi:hypothetical protein